MKNAILAVSFGTTYAEAEQTCIRPVEAALAAAYPDWEVRRAYTARIVMRRLRERGVEIHSVEEALAQLRAEGFEKIVLASTHMIPGEEYESLRTAAGNLPVSEPLMNDEADLKWMARRMGEIAGEEGRNTLFMGHGTDHAADETYVRLRALLPENAFLACVEGAHRLETILPELDVLKEKKLALAPLMLVAGDHAHNDLAGGDEDSWLPILTRRGFDVTVRMQGLGADEKVQARFVEKVGRALN